MGKKYVRTPEVVERVYETAPITTVKFDCIALMNQFTAYDLRSRKDLADQASALYEMVSNYENAQKSLTRTLEQIEDCVKCLREGTTPWYDMTSKALEAERFLATMRAKRDEFVRTCKLLGYEIEGLPTLARA